jgi:hypothetical protein
MLCRKLHKYKTMCQYLPLPRFTKSTMYVIYVCNVQLCKFLALGQNVPKPRCPKSICPPQKCSNLVSDICVLDVRVSDILASHILVWDVILVYGHFASAPNYLHILFCSYTLTKRIGNPGMWSRSRHLHLQHKD